MSNQIDSPKAPALADFRRGPGETHSVAKQALFRVAFRVDFGGQNPPKIYEISSFGAVCFASSFGATNLQFPEPPKAEKHWFYQAKTRFFMKSTFLVLGRFLVDFRSQIGPKSIKFWFTTLLFFRLRF